MVSWRDLTFPVYRLAEQFQSAGARGRQLGTGDGRAILAVRSFDHATRNGVSILIFAHIDDPEPADDFFAFGTVLHVLDSRENAVGLVPLDRDLGVNRARQGGMAT